MKRKLNNKLPLFFLLLFSFFSFVSGSFFGASLGIQKNENMSQSIIKESQKYSGASVFLDYRNEKDKFWTSDETFPQLDVFNRIVVDFKTEELVASSYFIKTQKSNPAIIYDSVGDDNYSVLTAPSLKYLGLDTKYGSDLFSDLAVDEVAIHINLARKLTPINVNIESIVGSSLTIKHILNNKPNLQKYKITAIYDDNSVSKDYSTYLGTNFVVMSKSKVLPGRNGFLFKINDVSVNVIQRLLSYVNKYFIQDNFYYDFNNSFKGTLTASVINNGTSASIGQFNENYIYYKSGFNYVVMFILLLFTVLFVLFAIDSLKLITWQISKYHLIMVPVLGFIIASVLTITMQTFSIGNVSFVLNNMYSFAMSLVLLSIYFIVFLNRKFTKHEISTDEKIKIIQQIPNLTVSSGLTTDLNNFLDSKLINDKYDFEVAVSQSNNKFKDFIYYLRYFHRSSAEIVLIRGAGVESFIPTLAAKLSRKKILLSVHGMWSDLVYLSKIKHYFSMNVIERMIFSMSDMFYTVYKGAVIKKIPSMYPEKYLGTIYNPIRISPNVIEDLEPNVISVLKNNGKIVGLYVGRISKEKGLEYLLYGLRRYLDEGGVSNLIIVLIGDGNDIDYLKKMVVDLRLTENVTFLGEKTNINNYLEVCDFFVFPSLHENHPNVILEACSKHKFIISTDVGGIKEILVHGENSLLFSPRSDTEIANALKKVINEKLYDKVDIDLFNDIVDKFSYNNFEDALINILKKASER